MRVGLLVLGCIAASSFGCTSERSLSPAQREAVATYVTDERPKPEYSVDATFADSVRLIGYDVDEESWEPGTSLRLVWYWEALAEPPSGTSLETRVVSDEVEVSPALEDPDGVRTLYAPPLWKTGQYIIDAQELALPSSWQSGEASVRVMLARDGVALPATGADVDPEGRAVGPTLSVPTAVPRDAPIPRLDVVRTPRTPRIDGDLTDSVWEAARSTGPFLDARTGVPASIRAHAKVLWDSRYLYVGVHANDPLLYAPGERPSDADSVVVLFAPSRSRPVYELRVSVDGSVEGTRIDSEKRTERTPWETRGRVAVAHRGGDDDRDALAGYAIEIALPWQAFSSGTRPPPRPSLGDRWRANFVTTDRRGDRLQVDAWSPVGNADVDDADRFGFLAFRGASERSIGRSGPLALPADRVRGETTREAARDADVRGALIKRRVTTRRHPGEPPPAPPELDAAALESDESPH